MRLFHISSEEGGDGYLGDTVWFHPRIPLSACCESKIPRICVCPTLSGCFLAAELDTRMDEFWYIYEAEEGIDSVPADASVRDRRMTRERWILISCKMTLIGKIDTTKIRNPWFDDLPGIKHPDAGDRRCLLRSTLDPLIAELEVSR
jgi:hypothetical protein